MSQRVQSFLLRNTQGLQYLVNERLAKRSGAIGRLARFYALGERQMGQHSLGRVMKVVNWYWVFGYQAIAMMRPVASRFLGVTQGPINISGVFMWVWATMIILSRFRFMRSRDLYFFNAQDNPEFWYQRYNMMFPPNFLHNRLSAHYIEINHIFGVEMMKKYQVARRDILAERDTHSDEVKRTKYITNPNYVYEPFGSPDDGKIQRMKDTQQF